MATFIAKLFTNTIRRQLEMDQIEEEYETTLKPKLNTAAKQFMDALCVYITNTTINKCKKDTITSSRKTIDNETEQLLSDCFKNKRVDLLKYIPIPKQNNKNIKGGGAAGAGDDEGAGAAVAGAMGVGAMKAGVAGAGAAGAGAAAGAGPSLPDLNAKQLNSAASPMQNIANPLSQVSNATTGNILDTIKPSSETTKPLFKTTKPKDILDAYTKAVTELLHCDTNMHTYINNHVIIPTFDVAKSSVKTRTFPALEELAKETTLQHMKVCIQLINSQLASYVTALRIAKKQPKDVYVSVATEIVPYYINGLFVLYIYVIYSSIVGLTLDINDKTISTHISTLKEYEPHVYGKLKELKYPPNVVNLAGMKLPAQWINQETKKNNIETIPNSKTVIGKFTSLFDKSENNKIKGGRSKNKTKHSRSSASNRKTRRKRKTC